MMLRNNGKLNVFFIIVGISFTILSCSMTALHEQYIHKGRQYFYKDNYQLAIQNYRNALELVENENDRAEIIYQIGLNLFILKEFEDSLSYLKMAEEINPEILNGRTYTVPSVSMSPTVEMGEMFIADKDYYKFNNIKRFDVVVFNTKESKVTIPRHKTILLIKRIVGLPGEVFEIKNGKIIVDGHIVEDDHGIFVPYPDQNFEYLDNFQAVHIPNDNYFVMGDNRYKSWDSRHFGFIRKADIVAKPIVKYGIHPKYLEIGMSPSDSIGILIK